MCIYVYTYIWLHDPCIVDIKLGSTTVTVSLTYVYTCIHLYVCVYIYIYINIYLYPSVYVYTYISMSIYIYIRGPRRLTHGLEDPCIVDIKLETTTVAVSLFIYMQIWIYAYICMQYMCIYMCTHVYGCMTLASST